MATLSSYNPLNLIEAVRRTNGTKNQAAIAEILAKDNEVVPDIPWQESTDMFSNKTVQRLSLPTGSYRGLNEGVAPESSLTAEIWDTIGFLESYSEVDVKLADAQPSPTQFRIDEASSFLEGMSQTFASKLIYGNARHSPKEFTGLAARLAATTNPMVLSASGTGDDLTSVYIVQWGLDKVFGIFPRNSQAGLDHKDLGETTKTLSTGAMLQVYRDHFTWDHGLVVRNPRCIARIANIETAGTTNIFDEDLLIKLLNKMPQRGKGACIYMNATIMSQLDIITKDKTNVQYVPGAPYGSDEQVMVFRGRPIRLCDAILDTESAIS